MNSTRMLSVELSCGSSSIGFNLDSPSAINISRPGFILLRHILESSTAAIGGVVELKKVLIAFTLSSFKGEGVM
jgi:hypothetical protein